MSSSPKSNTQDRQEDVSLTTNPTLDPINPDHENNLQVEVEALSYEYPEGGLSAWIVVAGASMMLACTFGMMSTVGVLQSYWETHQLQMYSSSEIGWISSLFVFLNLLLGVQVGPLFDRYGPRWVMLIGSILYTVSIFLLGSCEKYYQFLLCLGVLSGVSSALVSTPCLAVISHWFNRRRGTATGIAMAGSSLGGIIFPIILRPALDNLGWTWALRILGFIFFFFLAIGNMCIKSRFSVKTSGGTISLKCFADSRFIWATIGAFFGEIVVFTSLGLIPSYALAQGFGSETGFYLLSVFNAGSGLGRWLAGLASDHYGRFNTISVIMAVTALCIFVLWYPFGRLIGVLYPFVCLLGFGTGSILSLTPVCIGQLCKTEDFGQWVGTCYFVTSFG
ncbi:hypothetical protein PENSOL_c006G06856 [Penicillium solitum]|uniref:Major facilitator superfamily (MFS) profile domain-containing protein n=1 Tax=Penicillium solitum TaxID=60172 RepID=A0A1V6RDG2_9EURO|nr:uncharacterized protein PENSOL_c006G06856 [Penicillium solitum]OQD99580.1 hypothetical protein PENSOL_c006G06856 [Penicillium solitum]